jgi:ATP phosphoribosyltransferase
LALLLDAIDGVRASEGWLHLEVVGRPAEPAPRTAEAVAAYLTEQGAQHAARGQVWDARGGDAWRVTALVPAKKLAGLRRPLFALGAMRVVGMPTRFVFDRDGESTFDRVACGG